MDNIILRRKTGKLFFVDILTLTLIPIFPYLENSQVSSLALGVLLISLCLTYFTEKSIKNYVFIFVYWFLISKYVSTSNTTTVIMAMAIIILRFDLFLLVGHKAKIINFIEKNFLINRLYLRLRLKAINSSFSFEKTKIVKPNKIKNRNKLLILAHEDSLSIVFICLIGVIILSEYFL